jgi:hypothetical protein
MKKRKLKKLVRRLKRKLSARTRDLAELRQQYLLMHTSPLGHVSWD